MIDLVIPIFNAGVLLEKCLATIESSTFCDYRLVLVDDASTDPKVKEVLAKAPASAKIITNRQNLGFPATVNKGVRASYNDYVCILNQDTEPMPGWLDTLLDTMKQDSKMGVVGPLLLFHPNNIHGQPGGSVQHAGVVFTVQKYPYHRWLQWPADHPKVQKYDDTLQAVTGACMLIKRKVWDQVGGMAEVYKRGTFEDIEFCIRAKALMYKVSYQPASMLYHWVGGSKQPYDIRGNYNLFMSRVGGTVIYDEWMRI